MKGIRRIMIVEDNDDDFEALSMALEESGSGHTPIIRCSTGKEALEQFDRMRQSRRPAEESPRLILLDLKLPDMAGSVLLEEIKSDARLRQIPVIVVTSSSNNSDVNRCYDNGANSYVRKPLDLDGFSSMVERLRGFWLETSELPIPV
ncbi:response regulator [Sagittula sp. S175]|uniref:response regulator n=1 Tax=Sagittula sp. S175 TaxID=3415129 RepID=UPI003C7ED5BC